jgi:hypothetical protein
MSQIPSPDSRIRAFAELGKSMGLAANYGNTDTSLISPDARAIYDSIEIAGFHNPWFTPENVSFALKTWSEALTEESLVKWISMYKRGIDTTKPKRIAVIMAGNIPVVGFHDFLCTLLCGHHFIGKLSSGDKIMLTSIAGVLCRIEPGFESMIEFTENKISDFDAIIATGSNNTARYFEYYFSKYPNIIRKNRNGVAVISGNEDDEALKRLGHDICMYFGLGCRNVSKVFIPEGFAPEILFKAVEPYIKVLSDHYKYMNNHSYHSSIYLLNSTPHLDNGVILLTESGQYSAPIPVIYYEYYKNLESLQEKLKSDTENIQCIATELFVSDKTVNLGSTQTPGLADYADGIDVMKFLTDL